MKVSSVILPLLCATFASSRSLVQANQQSLNPSFPVPGDNPLTFCGNPEDYIGQVESVVLDPNPPVAGQKLVIDAKGHLSKPVDAAKVHLRVKYNKYITLINQVYDLCENLEKIDMECPLDGDVVVHREVQLPNVIPPGSYEVYADVVTDDGEQVSCMEATVAFHRG